jgi:hypothetical protein
MDASIIFVMRDGHVYSLMDLDGPMRWTLSAVWGATIAGQHASVPKGRWPDLECYHSGVALTGVANWICSHNADRSCELICGPGIFQYWSATTAGWHSPDLRTGFAATMQTLENSSITLVQTRMHVEINTRQVRCSKQHPVRNKKSFAQCLNR